MKESGFKDALKGNRMESEDQNRSSEDEIAEEWTRWEVTRNQVAPMSQSRPETHS